MGEAPPMPEQLERLRQAANLIHERFPDAATFDLASSDQNRYGFGLMGITLRSGLEVDPGAIEPILDELEPLLNDLDWDGVVGEDKAGYVTLPVHAQMLPVESVLTRVTAYLGDYTARSPYGVKDVKRAELRIRKALNEKLSLHVLEVRKEKDAFHIALLEPRRDLHAVASQVRHVVRGAMRELCPHMTLRVTARKLAPGRTARTFQDARAHENEVTVTVTIE